jgi:hypothetical protein
MIPKEIANQLVQLKEKAKTYSSIQRTLDVQERRDNVDEIKADVENINAEIADLFEKTDCILVDGFISKIEIENWFEGLKDKSDFLEPNPRIIYEEEQRELEKQRKIAEDRAKRKLEEIQRRKDVMRIEAERQKRIEELRVKHELEEIERQKKIEKENAIKEAEEHQKRLQVQRIEEFRKICINAQSEDIDKLQKLLEKGLDVNGISDFDDISRIVFWTKSFNFIKILVDSGLHITEKSVDLLWSKYRYGYNEAELLDLLINTKNIDPSAIKIVKEIVANQKKEKLELKQRNEKLQALKDQSQRVEDFKWMCQFSSSADITKLKKLIEEGLNLNSINDFDCLQTCISWGTSLPFIQLLIDSGVLVKNKHIEYCYTNSKHIKNSTFIISILENAKNIESEAVKNIRKRKKTAVIGSISMTCFGIFSLFLPKILNSEIDNFYYILVGIIIILSELMAIIFIVDLRKMSIITNTIHPQENQLPRCKQTEYEIPKAQGKKGITGSVKEFNHKEIKRKKMILWIVVTLISISIIALSYIYFEQIINFMKVLLIFIVVFALFAWRYSPTKRR